VRELTKRPEPLPRNGRGLRRTLAGLLIAALAALTPVLSAGPAGATRGPGQGASVTSAAAAAKPVSTRQPTGRGLRPAVQRSGATTGRRLFDDSRTLRPAHRHRDGLVHQPTCPATGSADPTGPPSAYAVARVRAGTQPFIGHHHRAAAGRAPPSSCGS
jgi:hypothetical protein